MNKFRKICVYLTVFFLSMTGASIFNVSLTKVALIPLFLSLILDSKNIALNKTSLNKNAIILLLFYFVIIISSIFGLARQELYSYISYKNKLFFNILQYLLLFIPITILFFLNNQKSKYTIEIKNAIVFLAKISCIWGITQFCFWNFMKIDFNDLIFNDFFKGFFGNTWSAKYQVYVNGKWDVSIRISGLSHEPAIFCLILLLGILLDKNILFKLLYSIAILLSLSRAGIIILVVVLAILLVRRIKNANKNMIIRYIALIFSVCCFFLIILGTNAFPTLKQQFLKVIERFSLIGDSTKSTGTLRHINYIPWALRTWTFDFNILQKLFGVGRRVSGIAFSQNESLKIYLDQTMLKQAWAIESDIADVLLGTGILGLVLYFMILFNIIKNKNFEIRMIGIIFFIYGFFYNAFIWDISSLIIMFSLLPVEYESVVEGCEINENSCYRC